MARVLLAHWAMRQMLWVAALAFVVGCGGKTDENVAAGGSAGTGGAGGTSTGGSGGTAAGGSGGTSTGGSGAGGSGGMPSECAVPTNLQGPYPLKIQITNPTSQKLYVREDCMLNWSLYSCADGYTSSVPHAADCMMECTDQPGMGCIACGACMLSALEVTAGQPVVTDWSGFAYTFGQNLDGCSCFNQAVAPAGKYAIKIPVYLSENDAAGGNSVYDAWAYFELPAPNGVVEVNLAALAGN
jgi:hypothetical protein